MVYSSPELRRPVVVPRAALAAVTGLGVAGFTLHAGPVYRGPGAAAVSGAPAAAWIGAGGLALLLAGLLAVPAQSATAARYREIVAVLSGLGFLLALAGIVDAPDAVSIGWAAIAIVVAAVVQTALAVVVALPAGGGAEPDAVRPQSVSPDDRPTALDLYSGVGQRLHEEHRPTAREYGDAVHQAQEPVRRSAPPPRQTSTPPGFTPFASPAATGAKAAQHAPTPVTPPWTARSQPTDPAHGAGSADPRATRRTSGQ